MLRHRAAVRLVTLALAAAASACLPAQRPDGAPTPSPDAPVSVVFENQSLYDAAVYALGAGGLPVRIGTVNGGQTQVLTLRNYVMGGNGSVTFVARLLAHRGAPSTGPIMLYPGDRVAVTLPSTGNILGVLPARARPSRPY